MSELKLNATSNSYQPVTALASNSKQQVPAKSAAQKQPAAQATDQLTNQPTAAGSAMPQLSFETQALQLTPATPAQIQAAVDDAIQSIYTKVPPRVGESRHDLNQRLQSMPLYQPTQAQQPNQQKTDPKTVHYDGSELVVIAFEGTGAFDARQAPIMQEAARRLEEQGLNTNGSLYGAVSSGLTAKEGKAVNWSGLAAGPLESLMQQPEIYHKTQWLSFPSEEFEALSHPSAIQNSSVKQLMREVIGSSTGETPGINQALKTILDIQTQAQAQGKEPKFVIISHSSGGRSAVKFLEKAKALKDNHGAPLQFPFALTIDPVREAHEAVGEAAKELINKGTEHNVNRLRSMFDALPLIEMKQQKVYPPLVRHRAQPESLYAPANVQKFMSFYQLRDTEGLKMEPRFGIQGSPVTGAINQEITDVGTAGHGEIAYNPRVTHTFTQELKQLLHK